ncbi:hypothetical protein CHS0354_031058 [Potamilus streckersoni]|uniref:Group XV phospholipase A2 n=1 Tax=Potamilus streckersoni TaxID=2493646 RepID=A0AAE0WC36_9BIVA|nr:hypothetical protein CHS0354_031058 [Potamilus streckersoni]
MGVRNELFLVYFYAILNFHLYCVASLDFKGFPVILVPGDGGSEFEAKLNKAVVPHSFCIKKTEKYFSLWLNLEELAPWVIDCFVDNMRLVYDNKTHKTSNSPGVDIRVPGFGDTDTVEWLDPTHLSVTTYFSPIVSAMVKWGYTRGKSVRGAPYDFRKAPNELEDYFQNLTELIEDTYMQNNNTRIVIIGHSMGNPLTLYFLNQKSQPWKDKFIRSHISLAGVWGGAVKTLRLMASGDNLGVPIVKPINVRREQRSMPSTAWLMPSDTFWTSTEILVSSPFRNYTVNDYSEFFIDVDFPDGYLMRKDTEHLIHPLKAPGVELHCLHGNHVDTPGQLIYTKTNWPNAEPEVIQDDGDGTVNIRSLQGCLTFQGKQAQPVHYQIFPKAEHMEILVRKDVIAYIQNVLLTF